jgi:hypothetical protein
MTSYDTAEGLPYYLDDSGGKVFIGFAANGNYLAPVGETVLLTPNPKNFTDISTHWAKRTSTLSRNGKSLWAPPQMSSRPTPA